VPIIMPKPVTVYDYQVRLKVPINMLEKAPQHFTNLHMGLQLARRILRRRTSENKQIFIITDGQPTAHVEGDFVYLPLSAGSAQHRGDVERGGAQREKKLPHCDLRTHRRLLGMVGWDSSISSPS